MFWVIFLMVYFKSYSLGMWVYLFLHGTYGFAWCWKDYYFPDATFKNKASFGSLIILFAFLSLYWCIPLPLAAGYGVSNPPLIRVVMVISIYLLGLYLMIASDYQKTSILAQKKGNILVMIRINIERIFLKDTKPELSGIDPNIQFIRNLLRPHFWIHDFLFGQLPSVQPKHLPER